MWGLKKATGKKTAQEGFTPLKDASCGEPLPPVAATSVAAATSDRGNRLAGPSLRELVRKRLLTDMLGGFANEPAGAVLCVDALTLRIISCCFRLSELAEHNIHLVENITMRATDGNFLRRQALPELPAIYFLTPSVDAVNQLLADFRDKKTPMYSACHLYFTTRLGDALLTKIKASQTIRSVACFKELNLEFSLAEKSVFLVDAPRSLPLLFGGDSSLAVGQRKQQEHHRIANSLATLFVTLGEMPLIRHENKPVASAVAAVLQEKLDSLSTSGIGFPHRILADHERPLLLLLDRSFDPLSPLLHEYSYQAMVHDLLSVQDDRYRYKYVGNNNKPIEKEVLLNETDSLWVKYRHMHIADLSQVLHDDYKQFLAEHKQSADLTKRSQDVKAMAEGLKAMPKFQEQTARYSMHINISTELVSKYNNLRLEAMSAIEQNMACAEDANGKLYKSALTDLKAFLSSEDKPLSPEDRMRLLMIYVITQDGVKQQERRELMELAEIQPEDQVAILNLFYLGVTLLQGLASKKKIDKKGKDSKAKADGYEVSRYEPPLRRLVEDLFSSLLTTHDFPYMRPPGVMPSAQNVADTAASKLSSWANSSKTPRAATDNSAAGRRVIIFVLGGITYSECREMQTLGAEIGREILLGSTSLLTPQSYIVSLKELKQLDAFA